MHTLSMTRYDAPLARHKRGQEMGSAILGEAISAIRDWSVTEAKEPRGPRATEAFGSLVFNDEVQQTRLPKPVYHALRRTMTHGEPLDVSVADAVASAMKEWAVEHGATHYTHWFQPLTGDRKSTRLNSSHTVISYAVFCLKKKKNIERHA